MENDYKVVDIDLADFGRKEISLAENEMPALMALRDKYKDHKYYNDTLKFCEDWDQASFDPNYKSLTLKDFEPLVRKIFSRKPYKN